MPSKEWGCRAVTVPVTTAGNKVTPIRSSCRLCGWSLGDAGFPPVAQESSAAVAAAAAGTLTLAGALSVSGFSVTPAAAWPAGNNVVTITNVQGGTQTFEIEGGTENAVVVTFSPPLPTSANPVISVPAIVGGPAYEINAEFTVSGGSPVSGNGNANLLDAGQLVGVSSPLAGTSDTQWLSDDGIYIGTAITVSVISGVMSGCIYVRDTDDKTHLH